MADEIEKIGEKIQSKLTERRRLSETLQRIDADLKLLAEGLQSAIGGSSTVPKESGIVQLSSFSDGGSIRQRIAAWLGTQNGERSVEEIATAVDAKPDTVRQLLSRLKKDHAVVRGSKPGIWRASRI